jgi:hypothetical protein
MTLGVENWRTLQCHYAVKYSVCSLCMYLRVRVQIYMKHRKIKLPWLGFEPQIFGLPVHCSTKVPRFSVSQWSSLRVLHSQCAALYISSPLLLNGALKMAFLIDILQGDSIKMSQLGPQDQLFLWGFSLKRYMSQWVLVIFLGPPFIIYELACSFDILRWLYIFTQ